MKELAPTFSPDIPQEIKDAFAESARFFPTPIQQFQFFDKYSRFNYEEGRRETWIETVDRSVNFLKKLSHNRLDPLDYQAIRNGILNMKVAPSMRLLAMAGEAAERQNIAIFNCSYVPIDSPDAWVEGLIISMSGCGVGFSVEKNWVNKLPQVGVQTGEKLPTFVVPDSTEGWAEALRTGINVWFSGKDIDFDYSEVRPTGAPLRVKGGRASGPEPLRALLDFAREKILSRQGSKLSPLDAHDIMCEVGNAAVSGGVRRTAMISLFDYEDEEMRNCKNGNNLEGNERRWNANNSAVWPKEISQEQIRSQMGDMYAGERGEPGIFSRDTANFTMPERRAPAEFGTNPCGEISLRPCEFCNLSMAIAREDDTVETLTEKVRLATIIGTIQSMATDFKGLRPIWKKNCDEERLLGVDITGQLDCPVVQNAEVMNLLKEVAIETNKIYAEKLDINPSASITCVKPSGNSSQLFNCASGLHARWAPYYVRNVRVSAHSPIYGVLKDAKVPMSPENGQDINSASTWVIHFPIKSPEGAITRKNRSAIEQCEYWLQNKLNWTEHNPSCTITYKPEEKHAVTQWVIENKDVIGGLSFLPESDAQYSLMPYQEIDQEQYEFLASRFPNIDFSRLYLYEDSDLTTASQELACMSGACEIDFSVQK